MATPSPSLRNTSVSNSQFASAIEAVKALHVVLASVMTDVAALRRTVLDDPGFAELYEKNLREASKTTRPLVAEAIAQYDEMIALEQGDNSFDN
jgi:hypothetical protein